MDTENQTGHERLDQADRIRGCGGEARRGGFAQARLRGCGVEHFLGFCFLGESSSAPHGVSSRGRAEFDRSISGSRAA